MRINEIISPSFTFPAFGSEEYDMFLQQFIEINCSQIWKLYRDTGKVLYRGFNNYDPLFVGEPVDNRDPKDTPLWKQQVIDKKLKEQNFIALRSNSIYCTSDAYSALPFGNVHTIFPFDNFSFTYSKFKDLTAELSYTANEWLKNASSEEMVKELEFKQTDLSYAILKKLEVYIKGKYLLVYNNVHNKDILEEMMGFKL